jgi:hypothetical protein
MTASSTNAIYEQLRSKPVAACDVTLKTDPRRVFMDEEGIVYGYVGYHSVTRNFWRNELGSNISGVEDIHSDDSRLIPFMDGFVQLEHGALKRATFIDDRYGALPVKEVHCTVRFPCRKGGFHVTGRVPADVRDYVERELFGLTSSELTTLLDACRTVYEQQLEQTLIYRPLYRGQAFRLTYSHSGPHTCDLSGAWIPPGFPCICFDPYGDGSCYNHISLAGFYQQLRLMLVTGSKSSLWRALVSAGATDQILRRACVCGIGTRTQILYGYEQEGWWEHETPFYLGDRRMRSVYPDEDIARTRLMFIGAFIAMYESFEDEVDSLIRELFTEKDFVGVEELGITYEKILHGGSSKNERPSKNQAYLAWLESIGCFQREDKELLGHVKQWRNTYVHKLNEQVFRVTRRDEVELFHQAVAMYDRFDNWWFKNIILRFDPQWQFLLDETCDECED